MFKRSVMAVVLAALMSWGVAAQDAGGVISAASKAMGADTLKTIQFSGSGADFALGQNANPNLPWPRFIDKTYTRTINFEPPASRVERIRMQGEIPLRGGGNQPLRGEVPQNQVVIVGANTPWDQQLDIWMTPYGFLRAAKANNATVKSQMVGDRKYNVVSFRGQNKAMVNGYINDQNLVERVETLVDNPMLGDMPVEWNYSLYKDFGDLKFPTGIEQKQGGYPTLELTITDVKPNVPADIKPAGGGGGGAPAAAPPSEKLADGVYLLKAAYGSLAVDFKDYIVVIEGPMSEERGVAVIAEAKRLIPNKPIRYVVNTHTHFDHSSGLRPFVAEGATVITHEVNRPFLEKVFTLPHTLNPDTLSAAKKTAKFETMTDKKVLTDGNHVIELYRQQGTAHHDGIIFVYLPKEKILMEGDGYNANVPANSPTPNPVGPYAVNLVENLNRLKLDVQRVVSIHMPPDDRVVTMQEVLKAIGRTTGTN
jgi:glyoxylase-like metal-dependent hydrolase (beta-lactamase superfamily II)